ncbi:zinc finger and SCAN domain-containing protein 31-like isoform X1 [Hippoglossus hippoglossus]|uniref:zinc finger and SCAN domain-containing protein 31-like isoform X1 n=1 Tax=Hippoglossus hippoglossus TaxID=8267 RepID=UPI00148E1279|nr:zinc finger and SCAN domain-containing protein 31-like isoform X1 [Hippoglossus hippoglossus]
MLRLDALRLLVDQRLSAVTDDIFRCLSRTVSEYEHDVFRLKQEIERQRKLLETAGRPGDTPGDTPAGVLLVSATEEEQPMRRRSFDLHIKQEGGASGPEDRNSKFISSPNWLRERPETDLSHLSNQIQSYREEAGPQPTEDHPEAFTVKQEVDEGHVTLEEFHSQQEGFLLISTTEEEQQLRGRSFSLHIKQEGGGASGSEEFTSSPDWLMGSNDDKGSSLSTQISSHIEKEFLWSPSDLMRPEPGCLPPQHHGDSAVQSPAEDSGDAPSEPGLQTPETSVEQKLLVCGSCGREFSSRRTLRKHIRQNTAQDQDQMSCSLRRQRAPFQSPAKSFSCRVCGNSFYTRGILVRHAENHCKEPENRCGACGDCLDSTENLRDHLRSHKELGSTCDVCGKKCSSIRRMEIHKRVHTGEKPYRCRFCSRDFSRKESLERHLKIHTGDRPHRCGLCRRTFTRREYLVHHLKTGHSERAGPSAGTEWTEQISLML